MFGEIESSNAMRHALLTECGDRMLAEDIYASIDLPRFNTSIMDGYAMNYALNNDQQSVGYSSEFIKKSVLLLLETN